MCDEVELEEHPQCHLKRFLVVEFGVDKFETEKKNRFVTMLTLKNFNLLITKMDSFVSEYSE